MMRKLRTRVSAVTYKDVEKRAFSPRLTKLRKYPAGPSPLFTAEVCSAYV